MKNAAKHLSNADPVMRGIVERVGPLRMEYRDPTFETLVRSIVFQQLSGTVARVILGRLHGALPEERITPEAILKLRIPKMRKLGLSGAKTEYIRDLARQTREGMVRFEELPEAPDEDVIAALTRVKGIGVWTAQMFLIFALRRPDVLPVGDLGVRKAIQQAYSLEELPKPGKMEELAVPWRPYCSAASWYLWRSLDGIAEI
ncbi:MAG: DNA-3-methyladenine glycosylase 2 family protein [Bryobacterales bacterium]|nr:DNA-3-methyladenine glycosylase 2 family protein [Bryobacterales bacterium]